MWIGFPKLLKFPKWLWVLWKIHILKCWPFHKVFKFVVVLWIWFLSVFGVDTTFKFCKTPNLNHVFTGEWVFWQIHSLKYFEAVHKSIECISYTHFALETKNSFLSVSIDILIMPLNKHMYLAQMILKVIGNSCTHKN